MIKLFGAFGLPRSITADNGPQFRSKEFRQFCKEYCIHLNLSTPYWPERNGAVERQNRNLGRRIKISLIEGTDWKKDLQEYLLMYHSTPQEATGISPARMMFNREFSNFLPALVESNMLLEGAKERDIELKEKKKLYANEKRGAGEGNIKVGDTVLAKNQKKGAMQPRFGNKEYEVTKIIGNEIQVKEKNGNENMCRNRVFFKKMGRRRTGQVFRIQGSIT